MVQWLQRHPPDARGLGSISGQENRFHTLELHTHTHSHTLTHTHTHTHTLTHIWASLAAQLVKNPAAVQETRVRFLDWEEPLEEEMATHSSILAWRVPMDRGAWWCTVHGVAKSRT